MKGTNMKEQWIVINGNPINGYTYYGAFDSPQDANYWGHNNFDESGFYITELTQPEEHEE
jgi:hypothetical protein